MTETEQADLLMRPRSCRCCGNSMSFTDRQEIDEDFKPGLDVCPRCILHFKKTSCLFGEPDEYTKSITLVDDPELISRMRREAMMAVFD